MRLTACECAGAGWCSRHQCLKDEPLFHQCRRNQDLFAAWESGRGPGLPVVFEEEEETDDRADSLSLARRALNFGKALLRHTADQLRQMDAATYDARLAICRQCSSCDTERMVCQQPACGCALSVKAWWASERCPLDRWPKAEPPRGDSEAETIEVSLSPLAR
jgi:hypothetical protein